MRIVCPLCKRVVEHAPDDFAPRPFCSPQCKLADLHAWLNESYRISTPIESTQVEHAEQGEVDPAPAPPRTRH